MSQTLLTDVFRFAPKEKLFIKRKLIAGNMNMMKYFLLEEEL
jgi:hypothetical protein